LVQAVEASSETLIIVSEGAPNALFDPLFPTLLFSGGPFAYLKIAEGCDHRCAYCAIPEIRGGFRSRDADAVFEEAFCMVQAGVRELNVISQDTLGYGTDRRRKGGLEALLRRIDSIEGDFWIRLLYGYPSGVSVELLEMLCESAHIVRYLDLPVQHSHPEILKAMNRGRAVKATQDLTERLRTIVPDLVLRTTCMVGFPGETERHFEHLVEYVRRSRFDHLGVFVFSPEEGTPAFAMEDTPELAVAQERRDILMQVQQEIVRERIRALEGSRDRVLLLHRERKLWKGRVAGQAPEVDGETSVSGVPSSAAAGDFIEVRITGGSDYDLKARYAGGDGA
jgi:ribosomal protein S12 methylthiotransferase